MSVWPPLRNFISAVSLGSRISGKEDWKPPGISDKWSKHRPATRDRCKLTAMLLGNRAPTSPLTSIQSESHRPPEQLNSRERSLE